MIFSGFSCRRLISGEGPLSDHLDKGLNINQELDGGHNQGGTKRMRISEIEKMDVLLEQLHIPEKDRENYFQESRLKKLKVYKESKTWHFYIAVKRVLPFHVFQLFITSLKHTFQQVENVA